MFVLDKECAGSDSEESTTLDESRCKNHVCLNLARSLWLTCDSIHCAAANLTDTKTCTNHCNTCSKAATECCETFCC